MTTVRTSLQTTHTPWKHEVSAASC